MIKFVTYVCLVTRRLYLVTGGAARIVVGASAADYASQCTTCYVYACIKFYVHAVGEVGLTQPC